MMQGGSTIHVMEWQNTFAIWTRCQGSLPVGDVWD